MPQTTLPDVVTHLTDAPYSNGHTRTTVDWLTLDHESDWKPCAENASGGFICSRRSLRAAEEKLGLVMPQGVRRWTAIGTYADPYWNRVKHGVAWSDVPAQTQFLLWEREAGGFGVLLPLLSGDHVNSLVGDKDGVRLMAVSGHKNNSETHPAVAYAATGSDIYALIEHSVKAIIAETKSFRLRTEKKVPAFVDHLGWCSWDAFYSKVDEHKFLSALGSFQKGGVTPGFVILDDGWLENHGDLLCGFDVNEEKFPSGLGPFVRRVKENYGIRFFGIWHALTGYWGGVDPGSSLAKKYDVIRSDGTLRPWETVLKKNALYLVDPRQAERFFGEFHDRLKSSGVDLIKVDGQSALAEFTRSHYGRVSAMRAYQQALQSSAVRNFDGGLIHCMSNGLDVAYQLEQTTVWRNSDDFFPKKTSSAQQTHVHTNAINNLWTGTFALPDWDMFQSHHRWAEFHAAARALSGGPVYVCDKPARQNFDVLRRLASPDGRVHRCDRPALPAPESIFTDCRREPVLLKIHNRSANVGLVGFFHCSEVRRRLTGRFSPADISDLRGTSFITRRYTTGEIAEMNVDEQAELVLPRMGFEIITVSPVLGGWLAPLGRTDRYVGATSLGAVDETAPEVFRIPLKESGSYLFWCQKAPLVMVEGGNTASSKYHAGGKLLTVKIGGPSTISIAPLA